MPLLPERPRLQPRDWTLYSTGPIPLVGASRVRQALADWQAALRRITGLAAGSYSPA